jgi:hypothetical protein
MAVYKKGNYFENSLVASVSSGGDTDTKTTTAGALLGAAHGRQAIPSRWIVSVLPCPPFDEASALRPRPMDYWPDDMLWLAEECPQQTRNFSFLLTSNHALEHDSGRGGHGIYSFVREE